MPPAVLELSVIEPPSEKLVPGGPELVSDDRAGAIDDERQRLASDRSG